MPDHDGGKDVVTPDGWLVAEFDVFRFLFDHSPPRPYAYVRLLMQDAKGWKEITCWIVGFGLITLGIIVKQWQCLLIGLLVLGFWFRMFWRFGRSLRHCPLAVGVVEVLQDHPMPRYWSMASARLPDGQETAVAIPLASLTPYAS